jgi:hypothetical protein
MTQMGFRYLREDTGHGDPAAMGRNAALSLGPDRTLCRQLIRVRQSAEQRTANERGKSPTTLPGQRFIVWAVQTILTTGRTPFPTEPISPRIERAHHHAPKSAGSLAWQKSPLHRAALPISRHATWGWKTKKKNRNDEIAGVLHSCRFFSHRLAPALSRIRA